MNAPIPQRIAPLVWRRPAFVCTPFGLAVAIGWPLVLFQEDPGLQRLALAAGLATFAAALVSLSVSWLLGFVPKTRRVVVLHVLMAGALFTFAAPFALPGLLAAANHGGAREVFGIGMAMALTPLGLVLVLPIALVSGIAFAWLALTRGQLGANSDVLGDGAFGGEPLR